MQNDKKFDYLKSVIALIICVCVTVPFIMIGYNVGVNTMKDDAVKNGFAEYNQTTGKWQWKIK